MLGLPNTRVQRNSVRATVIPVAFLSLLAFLAFADSARAGVPPQNNADLPVSYAPQFTIADFDGDKRPDLASVEFGRGGSLNYAINFRLASGSRQSIDISAPKGGLQLRAQDVNGDSFPDVVVTTLWTHLPVAVLLNDGRGNFTPSMPLAFPGAFGQSENSFSSGDDNKVDWVTLQSRYSFEPCEENAGADSMAVVLGRSPGQSFEMLASQTAGSLFGRAPPPVAVHS